MKGISIVVVMILLLLISIAFSSLAYMFITGSFSSITQTGEKTVEKVTASHQALMRIESVSDNKIYIRNIGQVELKNISLYIGDAPVDFTIDKETIDPGELATITISGDAPEGNIQISTPGGAISMQGGFPGYTPPPDNPPAYSGIATNNPATYSSSTFTWMNITWTDDNGVSWYRIESNHSGSPVNYTPTQVGNIYYLHIVLPAGAHRWRSFAQDTASQWTTSTTQTFTINRAASTVYLYINGSRASVSYALNTLVNYTVARITPSSGNVELWTNYSNGVNKQWRTGASPLQNLTTMSTAALWAWTGNYSITQNYTGDIETWYVTIT